MAQDICMHVQAGVFGWIPLAVDVRLNAQLSHLENSLCPGCMGPRGGAWTSHGLRRLYAESHEIDDRKNVSIVESSYCMQTYSDRPVQATRSTVHACHSMHERIVNCYLLIMRFEREKRVPRACMHACESRSLARAALNFRQYYLIIN
jgi:hypothetical protein